MRSEPCAVCAFMHVKAPVERTTGVCITKAVSERQVQRSQFIISDSANSFHDSTILSEIRCSFTQTGPIPVTKIYQIKQEN